jgi:hypothetical protein
MINACYAEEVHYVILTITTSQHADLDIRTAAAPSRTQCECGCLFDERRTRPNAVYEQY